MKLCYDSFILCRKWWRKKNFSFLDYIGTLSCLCFLIIERKMILIIRDRQHRTKKYIVNNFQLILASFLFITPFGRTTDMEKSLHTCVSSGIYWETVVGNWTQTLIYTLETAKKYYKSCLKKKEQIPKSIKVVLCVYLGGND